MLLPPSGLEPLDCGFVGDGEFFATLGATGGQHFAAIGGGHPLTETVFVDPLAARGLEGAFHCHNYLVLFFNALCVWCFSDGKDR